MNNKIVLIGMLVWFGLIAGIGYAESPIALNTASFLKMPSPYEQSGQFVHPSILKFKEPWQGYQYWMAATPYPGADSSKENPTILVSKNGLKWELKKIVDETGLHVPYNSDPCLVYDGKVLWLYWRYLGPAPAPQLIYRSHSADGSNWSPKELVLEGERETMCSPSITISAGKWTMYYSNAGKVYKRTSENGLHWSDPILQILYLNGDENFLFQTPKNTHLEVRSTPTGLFMLLMGNAKNHGKNLYLFSGRDNSNAWYSDAGPVMQISPGSWDGYSLYKASFLVDENVTSNGLQPKLRIWYSAYRMNPVAFHIGYTETLVEKWTFRYNLETNPWSFQENGFFFTGVPDAEGALLWNKSLNNGMVQTDIQLVNGTSDAGILFRYQNKDNYSSLTIVQNQLVLSVVAGGRTEERIFEMNEPVASSKIYQLKLIVTNKVYQAFLNEKPVLRLVSKVSLGSGYPGVIANNCNCSFRFFVAR